MKAKRLSYAICSVALIAAGFYVFVYLIRWEWNRALMAGVIFVATEVALVAALVFDRLRSIEARLGEGNADKHLETLRSIRESAPPSRRPFAWLTNQGDNLNVFVPVLMGAGVVISALAWAVERLAASTARPVLERRLTARLAPISLPAGGLTGAVSNVSTSLDAARRPFAPASRLGRSVIALVLGGVTFVAIGSLGDLTQNRPDQITAGTSSTVELEVQTRDAGVGSSLELARSLWAACQTTVGSRPSAIRPAANGHVSLVVRPALGKYATRRLQGCLEDATLDKVQARVVGISS